MPRIPDSPAGGSASGRLAGHDPASLLALGLAAREPTLLSGSMLGRYRIDRLLGHGGMGQVYAAEDTRLGRRVALKLLRHDALDDDGARLEKEARALAALNHVNIVTLYSIEEADGASFLTMELVEGRALDVVLSEGLLPLSRAVEIGLALAAALASAHDRQVLHRDLKPANVVLTGDGGVKVLDFGLARLLRAPAARRRVPRESSAEGARVGTVHYMSPEQVRGRPLDARSDLFSLGALLYELLTGRVAFAAESPLAVLEAVLRGSPPRPRELRSEIPPNLEAIVLRCLRKDPARRFRDAREVVAALGQVAAELQAGHDAAPPTRPRRAPWATPARRLGAGGLAAVAFAIGFFALRPERAGEVSGPQTVAVSPFEDLIDRPGEEYIAAGLTEALTARLARSPGLRVLTPRPGAAALSPRQLAGRFGARAVVAGSVSRTADRIRLSARLIAPDSGELLWAGTYERAPGEVLALETEATGAIAREIRRRLLGLGAAEARSPAVRPEAYEHYLKGLYQWNRRHPRSLLLAVEELDEAIRLDPGFAPAQAALAACYNVLSSVEYGVLPPREAMPRARAAALRALELDPELAAAYVSLGHVDLFFDWDLRRAETDFRRAIELDPRDATAREWYSLLLSLTGRGEQAHREAERARELDPLSPILYVWLGNNLFYAGEHAAAVARLEEALELDPGFVLAHLFLARTLQAQGGTAAAEASYRRALALSDESPSVAAFWGHYLAASGRRREAQRLLARLEQSARERYVPAFAFGAIQLGLGEEDRALDWLERAVEERSGAVVYLGSDPITLPLRDHPRFRALLAGLELSGLVERPVAGR